MGENATLKTSSRCRRPTVPARVVPWRRPTDVRCCRSAAAIQLAIGRKTCHERPAVGCTFQWPNGRAGIFQVPDSGRFVHAGRDEPLAIDRKTDGCDRPLMALERHERRALRSELLQRPAQILIVPSLSAVASFAPSLEKAIAEMGDA